MSKQSKKGGGSATAAAGGTQYEQWKNKTGGAAATGGSTRDDSDDEAGGSKSRSRAPKGSQRQMQRAAQLEQAASSAAASSASSSAAPCAGRAPKAARVPIKVERAKATRQADIDSGVAGALREVANKKKQKAALKKKKRAAMAAAAGGSDDEEDSEEKSEEEEQSEESEESGAEEPETKTAATTAAASSKQQPPRKGARPVTDDDDEDEDEEEESVSDDDDAGPDSSAADPTDTAEEAWLGYRERHAIHVRSIDESVLSSETLDADPMLAPVTEFAALSSEFQLDARLVAAATRSFTKPSPIQAQCWPVLLQGKDCIGVAQTGSGKSLAFILPALFYIWQRRERDAAREAAGAPPPAAPEGGGVTPRVLVLAPTRELAIQICKVAEDIATLLVNGDEASAAASSAAASSSSAAAAAAPLPPLPPSASPALRSPIQTYVLFGGTSIDAQVSSLRSLSTLELLVATPGRLLKHLGAHSVSLSRVGFFVLDEADRMLDLGFEAALRDVSAAIPANRQTALFSATWEASAQAAASAFLSRGAARTVKIVIGSEELSAAASVTQVVEVIDRRQGRREKRLLDLLAQYHGSRANRILIFVLYKKEAPMLADFLVRKGWKAASISGDRSQAQRIQALEAFRSGECPILVATDVAARGLDVKNITHVLNFSLGLSVEQYIHRIGRCGRAGATGTAHTFVVDYDAPHTPELVKLLTDSGHAESVSPELREMAERAARQAAKHANDPASASIVGAKGDAYYLTLKAGLATKNVNLARQLAKEAEEAEIEARIFGEDAEDNIKGGVQKGKKQATSQVQRSKAGAKGKNRGKH